MLYKALLWSSSSARDPSRVSPWQMLHRTNWWLCWHQSPRALLHVLFSVLFLTKEQMAPKNIKATGSEKKNKKKNMSVSLATQYTENQKGTGKWKKYRYGNAPATHTHTPRQFRHLLLWCTVSNICVLTLVITIKHVDLLKIKFNATWWLSSLNHYCGWWLIDSTVPRCCRQ